MFSNNLLESRPVLADQISGIKPPFLNLTFEGFMSSNLLFSATLGRPFTFLLDPEKVKLLSTTYLKYFDSEKMPESTPFQSPYKQVELLLSTNKTGFGFLFETSKKMSLEHRFTSLKSSTKIEFYDDLKIEANLVFKQLRSTIDLGGLSHSLLDPVNLEISAHLTAELDFQPLQGTAIFSLGRACFHLGPHHVFVLDQFSTLIIKEFVSKSQKMENIQIHLLIH